MINADISFSYRDDSPLFSHLCFSISEGKKLKIIAPPGSGKTTLAKILTGVVPAYSGGVLDASIDIDGKQISVMSASERMPFIGRVSQNTDEMLLFSSAEEEIAFPLSNLGIPEAEISGRMNHSLMLFGLEALRRVPSSELSGGEKRRLMLAVLFAVDPEVYILDESFDELSPGWRSRLVSLINSSKRTFIILGSHNLKEYDDIDGDTVTIENGALSAYEKENPPRLSYIFNTGKDILSCKDLCIMRSHRSLSEKESFSLTVPAFSLKKGECVVITGENGTGKSSFSRSLCGLLAEKSGAVEFNGRKLPFRERKKSVAFLMQNPYEELFLPTVLEEMRSTGASDEEITRTAELFHVSLDWYISEISYGKAKLVQAMLFFLLKRPFAVFDEFDSSLPYAESMNVLSAFLSQGAGIIVITHDEAFSEAITCPHMRVEDGVLK